MKDVKATIAALKALLFEGAPSEEAPAKVEVKAKDGKVYTADKLEAGGVLSDGENLVPAGEIVLEDDSIIVVGEAGVISEIKAPVAAAEEPKEDPKPEVTKEDFDALNARFTALEDLVTKLTGKETAKAEAMRQMFALVEVIAAESADEPTGAKKHEVFATTKSDKDAARASVRAAFQAANAK